MFLLDPHRGRRRRAIMRDKAISAMKHSGDGLNRAARDIGNRARGSAMVIRTRWSGDAVDDDVLVARVRSHFGRAVLHPGAIQVTAAQGCVHLSGTVLRAELEPLLRAVSTTPGVREIRHDLDIHNQADVPELQGGRVRHLRQGWPPGVRLLTGIAGGALAIFGLSRRGPLGIAAGVIGTGLATRAVANADVTRLVGAGGGRRGVDIVKTIEINVPVAEVWSFWNNFENFPRFMTHLREVRDLGNGRSHWVAEGPAGTSAGWNAEITLRAENQMLAWKSTPDSVVRNAGIVRFDPTPNGGTRVHIRLSYNPPAGALGHAVAKLFHRDPRAEMDDDLVRLKSLLEDGKTRGRDRTPVTREALASSPRADA
jgi:uncharacterized membrane protein